MSLADKLQTIIENERKVYEAGKNAGNITLDPTLTEEGKAADAKATGDALSGKVDKEYMIDLTDDVNTALSIAKEKNYAKGYQDYQSLINELNTASEDKYRVGQSFLIITLNVPDLWVSAIESENEPYTYTDDTAIVSELETNGVIKIGNYKLSMLETLKQDLTNYVQKNQYGNDTIPGLVKVLGTYYGLWLVSTTGQLEISRATNAEIEAKTQPYKPIVPKNLDKAVFEGLKNNPNEFTAEEQAQIQGWLGIDKTEKHQETNETASVIVLPNTEYYFNELETLDLSFSDNGNLGDMFYITFYSGETATVLTVDSTNAIFEDFVPNANSYVEIMGKWNGSKWLVLFSQIGV